MGKIAQEIIDIARGLDPKTTEKLSRILFSLFFFGFYEKSTLATLPQDSLGNCYKNKADNTEKVFKLGILDKASSHFLL